MYQHSMMPCFYLHTNHALALSSLLSFFLLQQMANHFIKWPTNLLKQTIIPDSKLSDVPCEYGLQFLKTLEFSFQLKFFLFLGKKDRQGFVNLDKSNCPVWYWDTFYIYIYICGEKKSTTSSKFHPLISTVITVSFSNRKLEDEPHWRPEGPASSHCFGSSPTHQTLCCGVLSVDSNSQGRATGSLCREHPEGTPGTSSPGCMQALQGRFCSGPHWPSLPVCWAGKAPGTASTLADTKMNNLSFLPRQIDNIARNTEVPKIARQQGARMAFL